MIHWAEISTNSIKNRIIMTKIQVLMKMIMIGLIANKNPFTFFKIHLNVTNPFHDILIDCIKCIRINNGHHTNHALFKRQTYDTTNCKHTIYCVI